MNTKLKYDPEDIESLLLHKQFHELYPEEKEFVLRHVEGQEEYESMRHTLFMMQDLAREDEWQEPDPSIKRHLMRQFSSEEKKGFRIWLNSLFIKPQLPEIAWYRRPAVRYAFASLVLLIGIGSAVWIFSKKEPGSLASKAENTNEEQQTELNKNETTVKRIPTYAENHTPHQFPPAPAPVFNEMSVMEMNEDPALTTDDIAFIQPLMANEAEYELREEAGKSASAEDLDRMSADDAVISAKPPVVKATNATKSEEEKKGANNNFKEQYAEAQDKTLINQLAEIDGTGVEDKDKSGKLPQKTFNNTAERTNPGNPSTKSIATQSAAAGNTADPLNKVELKRKSAQVTTANASSVKDMFDVLYTAK